MSELIELSPWCWEIPRSGDMRVPGRVFADCDLISIAEQEKALEQVRNVASDVFVQEAWARGQDIAVHGWVYSLANGLVTDLDVTVSRPEMIEGLD